ncbi:MAG: AAA family ATPase [Candidatus Jordarchaeaceae archaeon]
MAQKADAIFDPLYIPPKLYHREKELNELLKIITDNEASNLLIYGPSGIGKTLLARYALFKFPKNIDFEITPVFVNFCYKSFREIMYQINASLCSNKLLDSIPIDAPLTELWNVFRRLRRDIEKKVVIILDDVDTNNHSIHKKFLQESKELDITTIATAQTGYARKLRKEYALGSQLDYTLFLDLYSENELMDITLQRVTTAFPSFIRPSIIRFLTDIVLEFDIGRPSTVIEILKRIYPLSVAGLDILPVHIQEASSNIFTIQDELSIIDALTQTSLMTHLLFQKIARVFQKYLYEPYISLDEIKEKYNLLYEELKIDANQDDLLESIDDLLRTGLIFQSHFDPELFYIIIPPKKLIEILELTLEEKGLTRIDVNKIHYL